MSIDTSGTGGGGDGALPSLGPDSTPSNAPNTSPGLSNTSATSGSGFNPLNLAGPAIYGIGSYLGGQATNDANSAEGAANRLFASQEAETSRQYDQAKTIWQATHGYQNTVADMKAAGLNPAMMYAKSMSPESGTGGGGSAASAPGNPIHTNALGQALSSASQAASIMNDIRQSDADIVLKNAQAATQGAQALREVSSANNLDEQTDNLARQSKVLNATYGATQAEAAERTNRATISQKNESTKQLLGLINQGTSAIKDATGAFNDVVGGLNPIGGAIKSILGKTQQLPEVKGMRP